MHRRHFIASSLFALTLPRMAAAHVAGFQNWVGGFRRRAQRAGISDRTLDMAFVDVRYLPDSVARDNNQSEFVRPLADYIATDILGNCVLL